MNRKPVKQKRLTARRVKKVLEAIKEQEFEEAMNICTRYRISPRERGFILQNEEQEPEVLAVIISTKRKERKAR